MKALFAAIAVVGLACVQPVPARAVAPTPEAAESRIAVVGYDPEQVVELQGDLGYQMLVEFDPSERIENVAIGDALGWQVTPNRKANLLFLKPMQHAPATNMTVVTSLRRYLFQLSVRRGRVRRGDGSILYAIRFVYPEVAAPVAVPAEPPVPPVQDVNHAYSFQGPDKLLPARVFDDGKATYFQFREGDDYPAIFALEADGGEAVVNTSTRDGYVVVDRVARGFLLRRGGEVLKLFNDGFQEAAPGPLSPKPRQKPKSGWFFR